MLLLSQLVSYFHYICDNHIYWAEAICFPIFFKKDHWLFSLCFYFIAFALFCGLSLICDIQTVDKMISLTLRELQ